MPNVDGNALAKDYAVGVPFKGSGRFHVRGMNDVDWGMKDRLSRIFRPQSGKTIMLAFDHGYIMGSTTGLERLDLNIPPLIDYVDVLMGTRGAIRAAVPPNSNKPIALRCSAGSTVLDEDMSLEYIGVDIEDAIRMNASLMAVQVFIGSPHEAQNIKNLVETVDAGNRYSIPVLGVCAVGKQMERNERYFLLATRVIAELGAHVIKTYYCEPGFDRIVAALPVPVVIAGGKKIPERDAIELAWKAIDCGAAGVDMGRNIFQAEDPIALLKAINAIVHEGERADQAWQLYLEEKGRSGSAAKKER
ncbi:MAG: 3-hydroxy-5-phosphonooxypentane-2,4-dione thiolase [Syntrophales bacterium]